eukprot:s2101_g18.t1
MVVQGELLEDGDIEMEFPDKPPELTAEEMFEVEAKAAELEVTRLVEMGVLVPPGDDRWSWTGARGTAHGRVVVRDLVWVDPGRTDVFAPAGGQSLLRIVPAIGQVRGWQVISIDVKDG